MTVGDQFNAATGLAEREPSSGDESAVTRFARWHNLEPRNQPERRYRDLIPLTEPLPGQQFGFEVDLDKCSGCKACVSACHSLNGLDEDEVWRDVGLLVSQDWRQPLQQTITTACHHCVEPACLDGCPVLAYDKDPVTGIVRHLDDQCIGCQYCIFKCPYDVPKYSSRRGIVRKCDLCSHRLAVGEAPACVQACPNEAIRISLVETAALQRQFASAPDSDERFLRGAPRPDYTGPTTRYLSATPLPESVRAADQEVLRPQAAHAPLVLMLTLSQFSVGLITVQALLSGLKLAQLEGAAPLAQALAASVFGWAAAGCASAHLGRPLGAWRSFLGLRRSWLSREVVAFGLFLGVVSLYTLRLSRASSTPLSQSWLMGLAAVALGWLTVFCSAMVYHDTRREYWRLPLAGGQFLGATLLLGGSGSLLLLTAYGQRPAPGLVVGLTGMMGLAGLLKLGLEQRVMRHVSDDDFSPLHKTALLLEGRFGPLRRAGRAATILGAIVAPSLMAVEALSSTPGHIALPALIWLATLALGLCFGGELIERRLFFQAVQPARMPGALMS